MNLLIVDDEVPILNALKRSITSENPDIDITVCSTVSGVKELLFKNKFDCIVSDLNMPEEDGLSLIKFMKDESIEIPLIIMTGCPKTESAVECMKSGAVDFVSKPVSTSELITKVNDYCLSGHKKWSKGYTIKDYAVKELISETASSLVFTARKKDSEDTFVIKALKKDGIEFNDIELKRFQIEIDILRKLNHPNIVNIIEYGTTPQGVPYIIMPFVKGTTLKECIDNLDEIQFIDIMLSIAETLVHVHCRNLVHRDIKPGNILISDGRPVLLDFGVVLVKNKDEINSDVKFENIDSLLLNKLEDEDADITADDVIVGTPNYMAPEAFMDSHKVDYRADLYSLGAILYRYAYGAAPYQADGVYDVIRNLMSKKDEELYHGSKYDELLKQLINKNQNLRMDSVLTLSEELYKIRESISAGSL